MSGFDFVGGNLAIDFVNTEKFVRGKKIDLMQDEAALQTWWAEAAEFHGLSAYKNLSIYDEVFIDALRLRGQLRELFLSVWHGKIHAGALNALNLELEGAVLGLKFDDGAARSVFSARNEEDELVLRIALAAHDLLAHCEAKRLRACRNEHCIRLFYDTTKSGTRQWCSEPCMNRARSRELYRKNSGSL